MSKFNNVLLFIKTSKLRYIIDKYGLDCAKKAPEYNVLKDSMTNHEINSEKFLNKLKKILPGGKRIDIINDNFTQNDEIEQKIQNNNYGLIFSLGGDGTFLRASNFLNHNEQVLIGLNTDKKNSYGFYCSLNTEDNLEKTSQNLSKILSGDCEFKILNKIEIARKNNKHYFLNDLYFGEKFSGRISKYKLQTEKHSEVIKSSGVIFSTCIFNKIIFVRLWVLGMDSKR